jgi:hypothetical protein
MLRHGRTYHRHPEALVAEGELITVTLQVLGVKAISLSASSWKNLSPSP